MIKLIINEYRDMTGKKNINFLKVFYNSLFNDQFKVRVLIQKMQKINSKFKKMRIKKKLLKKYRIDVGLDTVIGKNLSLQHVEIGGTILRGVIGDNCVIYHQVTLGQRNIFKEGTPSIGNGVIIYTGAKIVGNIHVGDNAVIGANAVFARSVEKCTTVIS